MSPEDITTQLIALRDGRREVLDRLMPAVYDTLRAIAHQRLGRAPQTLDTTSLVHEAYLKLFDHTRVDLRDRRHFFALAAVAMRQIVVDHARRRSAAKRGGGQVRVDLDADAIAAADRQASDIVALDDALVRLKNVSDRLSRVVELRFFVGLSVEETAEVLEVDPRTVKRDWRKARALLHAELAPDGA